jgi:hypothetical protein
VASCDVAWVVEGCDADCVVAGLVEGSVDDCVVAGHFLPMGLNLSHPLVAASVQAIIAHNARRGTDIGHSRSGSAAQIRMCGARDGWHGLQFQCLATRMTSCAVSGFSLRAR